MFEKEAEEWVENNLHSTEEDYIKAYKDGAEFGYNKAKEDADIMKSRFLELCNLKDMRIEELEKANEWHYPSKGELPKASGNYILAFYGAEGSVASGKPCCEEIYFDAELLRWKERDTYDDLPYLEKKGVDIAWRELPEPPKVKE